MMARRGSSDEAKEAAALRQAWRMIAVGERPVYRVRWAEEGRWIVVDAPWLSMAALTRGGALASARVAIAAWLEVESDAFDVEVG
jgi:hypothetical protein